MCFDDWVIIPDAEWPSMDDYSEQEAVQFGGRSDDDMTLARSYALVREELGVLERENASLRLDVGGLRETLDKLVRTIGELNATIEVLEDERQKWIAGVAPPVPEPDRHAPLWRAMGR